MMRSLGLLLFSAVMTFAAKPHVVFVLGDHEYSGEHTFPIVAAELEAKYGMQCTVLKSVPDQNGETDIPGLEALRKADLAIFYLRWRKLPANQLAEIEKFMMSGRPMIGFRTTSHSFNYPKGDPLAKWNGWAAEAFGTPPGWGADGHTHYGHKASTDVAIAPGAEKNPLLAGITGPFHVRSWLYRVGPKWPPPDATVLLLGTAVNPDKPADVNPVAWTWTNQYKGRVFYTSMGHPEDFSVEPFQRLSLNAIHWALKKKPSWKGPMNINVPYRGMVSSAKP